MSRRQVLFVPLLSFLLLIMMSCDISTSSDLEKGSGIPDSFSKKALLEIAASASDPGSDIAEEIAARLSSGIEAYRDVVYVLAFHIDDPLTLILPKTSELNEFRSCYIDGILGNIGDVPAASISRRRLEDAFYSLFIGCSRWEQELSHFLPLDEGDWQTGYGLKLESSVDGSTICAKVYIGFAEKPPEDFFVTLFIVEDGVEVFRKGCGYLTYNWVVRGLMKPPGGSHCPFGYPLYATSIRAGEYVALECSLSLEEEIVFKDKENLKILAVLHETWFQNEEGDMIPGPVINVQQVKPGHSVGWD